MNKIVSSILVILGLMFFGTSNAYAHVTIKPGEVGVGERLNFVVSVPTEEDDPTVAVRLVIPEGVQSVRPNAKSGWNIQLKKSGTGDKERVTEIVWSGGRIPAEQRDEFLFSAQAPSKETNLIWKAYQTYGNGDIVAWETDPKVVEKYAKLNTPAPGQEDIHNAPRPYSQTKVIDDLSKASAKPAELTQANAQTTSSSNGPTMLSLVAIVLSAASIGMQLMKKK